MSTNHELFERARAVIPGGVNSPVRAFGSVGGEPYFVARAQGAHVWDVEGRRYTDFVQSYGASILGHARPEVVEAVRDAAGRGTSYGAPTENEVRLAEEICGRVPSCDRVRLVNSGTEATMTAVRLARGFTGRDRIVKFAGNYHGHGDALLAESGSGVATLGLPGSAGVTPGSVAETTVVAYNAVPPVSDDVACVIVEPVAANMGVIAPADGFLEGLRAACDRSGALLVFDEVITGFRLGPGGAQERLGVRPDLSTFGKIIGGGLPVGAFGGREDVMAALAPSGPVYQAGTLSGNPLATAAGLAVLDLLDEGFHRRLEAKVQRFADRLRSALDDALDGTDRRILVSRVGTLLGLHVGASAPVDYVSAQRTDEAAYARFFHALLDRGVAIAPGAYEALFVSAAHDDAELERVVSAAAEAAADALGGTG